MSTPHIVPRYWEEANAHLSGADPVMGALIQQYTGETLRARGEAFYTLSRSIVGQQISVKAADSVWNKLVCHPRESGDHLTPTETSQQATMGPGLRRDDVEKLSDEDLRACGLSAQKVKYLRAVADYFKTPPDFVSMDDAEVLASLTSINGVGEWTAQMFMIFHLLKPDVLPLGDIGLLKGIGIHYGDGKNKVDKATAQQIATPWAPYRSVATWYLWRSLDPVPVEY